MSHEWHALTRTIFPQYLSILYFDLLRVQHNLASSTGDFEIDLQRALVFP